MPFRRKDGSRYRPKRKRVGARAFPLRKIIRTEMRPIPLVDGTPSEYLARYEVLECGHAFRPRTDVMGYETNANARRCRDCAREQGQ
jgi:hypothetical protein